MVVLGGVAVSYERGTIVGGGAGTGGGDAASAGRRLRDGAVCEAGPPNHHDDKVDSGQ